MKPISSSHQLKRLLHYLHPRLGAFITGLVCLFIASAASLALPRLLGQLIDARNNGQLHEHAPMTGIFLAVTLLAQAVFSFLRTVLFVNVAEKTMAAVRQSLYNHLITLPMNFFLNRRVGELNSRLSADISLLQEMFTNTFAELFRQLVIVIGGVILLLFTSANLTVFMLAVLPVTMLIAVFFSRFIRRFAKEAQQKVALSNTVVEETLQGILNVKAFANELFEMARYREHTNEAARIGSRMGKYKGGFSSFVIIGIFGALTAIIWQGVMLGLASGQLFSFLMYSLLIGSAVSGLAEAYSNLQKNMGATEHIFALLDEQAEPVADIRTLTPYRQLLGEITFRHVAFSYPSRENPRVLKDISFTIKAEQQVAIVGLSGAGKSTIVSLMLRLYDPVGGTILFDGEDQRRLPLTVLRSQIGIVPQDVYLFGGSIGENIGYGKPGASREEIEMAARQANAWEFIQRFPLGLDTLVGERGLQLSGGQRQRIAIARAVLKSPRILILDEATSALDMESEKLVQDALNKLMRGRTSIVIAHRLATIRHADKIIVLDDGLITEAGTHTELIGKNGLYRQLSEMQFIH